MHKQYLSVVRAMMRLKSHCVQAPIATFIPRGRAVGLSAIYTPQYLSLATTAFNSQLSLHRGKGLDIDIKKARSYREVKSSQRG